MSENMISLKLPKSKNKSTTMVEDFKPEYPWGLGITLEDDTLDKLSVKLSDYKVGEEVVIEAKCKITRISQSAEEKGRTKKCIDLQITDMFFGVEDDSSEEKDDDELSWEDDRDKADKKMKKG